MRFASTRPRAVLSAAVLTGCAGCIALSGCSSDPAPVAASPAGTSPAASTGPPAAGGTGASRPPSIAGTPAPRVSAPPAPFAGQVRYADGIQVQATAVRQGVVQATGPGELTGKPVTTFSVTFANRSPKALDLNRVSVEVQHGEPAQSAAPVYDSSVQDFATTVAPGTTAEASYKFSIPVTDLGRVTMRVRFDPQYSAATFVGRISPPK